jgi:hypothetical protein
MHNLFTPSGLVVVALIVLAVALSALYVAHGAFQ